MSYTPHTHTHTHTDQDMKWKWKKSKSEIHENKTKHINKREIKSQKENVKMKNAIMMIIFNQNWIWYIVRESGKNENVLFFLFHSIANFLGFVNDHHWMYDYQRFVVYRNERKLWLSLRFFIHSFIQLLLLFFFNHCSQW